MPDNANDSTVTILTSANKLPCAKTFVAKDGGVSVASYGAEWEWNVEQREFDDIDGLGAIVKELGKRSDCIVIYGEPITEQRERVLRRKHDDATFADASRRWLAIDVDGVQTEATSLDEQIHECWESLLPAPLRGITCYYQLTSSQGISDGLRIRFWFVMDRGVHCEVLRQRFKNEPVVDHCVFMSVQPIYVCNPRFKRMAAPVSPANRVGKLDGIDNVVSVASLDLAEHIKAAELSERAGASISRKDVTPSQGQIDLAIEKILSQKTDGSRHHHALGAACELYALGTEPSVIADTCAELLRSQGRDPQPQEVANFLREAAKKDRSGALKTTNQPVSSVLGDDPIGDDPTVDPAENEGLGIDLDAEDYYDAELPDGRNFRVFLKRTVGNDNYVRWRGQDWFYNGKCWDREDDSESLSSMIAQDSGDLFSAYKLDSLAKRGRRAYQKRRLDMPGWIDEDDNGTGRAAGMSITMNNGILPVEDALMGDAGVVPHTRNYFSSTCLPFDFDPDADCRRFKRCVQEWFPGDPDTQREFQKMAGYLLVQDNRYEKFFILTDRSEGRSGKGTACRVLTWLLGDGNYASLTMQSLGGQFGVYQLIGKPAVFINEANIVNRRDVPALAIDRLKMITGNDDIEIEQKRADAFTTQLPSRFVMSCNTVPNLYDPSGALLKRMHILRFGQTFEGHSDPTLKDIGGPLHRELPGIFNWALEGLRMLMYEDKGFTNTPAGEEIKSDFARVSAPLKAFVSDCMKSVLPTDGGVTCNDMYQCYRRWCDEQGLEYPKSKLAFGKDIKQHLRTAMQVDVPLHSGSIKLTGSTGVRQNGIRGVVFTELGESYLSPVLDD